MKARDRTARDRNREGRPQQARPRDELGRPLPYGARGVEPVPEDPLPPRETVETAMALLESGRPFSAHEVFEARWKDCPESERPYWQGLAQVCVAITHARRGNATGARRLLDRGTAHVRSYLETRATTYGLDAESLLERARREVDALSG